MAAGRVNKEEGHHCSLDTYIATEIKVIINDFHTMPAHTIKECNKDPIFTATGKLFQMKKPKDTIILSREKAYAGVESGFCNNISIKPNKNQPLAESEVDRIKTTTIETRKFYRFGAVKKIVVLAG